MLDHKTVNERDEIYGCAEFLAALLIPLQHLCNGGKSDVQHQTLKFMDHFDLRKMMNVMKENVIICCQFLRLSNI